MKTIGIIAEYNPFHNGHAYQIAELKRKTNADFVVIAMSGDFVQRGAPAIIDKYCRAEMWCGSCHRTPGCLGSLLRGGFCHGRCYPV